MEVAEDRHAVVDRVAQARQRGLEERRAVGVVVGGDAVLGDEDRDAGRRVHVADRVGERRRVDVRAHVVSATPSGGGSGPAAS